MEPLLGSFDWIIIILYFVLVFGVAIWGTIKERKGQETSQDYFLAGRNVGWFVIGASLFASNIGSEHLVGLAGSGAASGVAPGQFEVLASLILLLLGWVFVPFYLKSGVFTMPEFLERRYSEGSRWYLASVSILAYILTKISVTIFAGAVVFSAIGVDFWVGALIIVIATGIYTVFGGLRAVLYTDLLQTFVLIGGAIAVTLLGLSAVGGWDTLTETVGPGFMSMWKPASDPDFPWTGILFGAPILGIWYWCTDQFIVQRTLSAKSIDDARRGTIFAGFLKLLPVFLFVLPGLIAYALESQGQIMLDNTNEALPTLVSALLPIGLRGLVVAGLLAALMSSLSSVFNSCSTLITLDVYKKLHPEASERQLVWIGRAATVALVVLGMAWIPFVEAAEGGLYVYIQSVQAYISPPIAAVFLFGLFWKRLNAQGALASLLTGLVLGVGRLVLEMINDGMIRDTGTGFAEGTFAAWAVGVNFLHIAVLLFVICGAVLIGVSLMTPAPSEEKLKGLTFATTTDRHTGSDPAWRRLDLWLTVALIVCVLGVWLYFS